MPTSAPIDIEAGYWSRGLRYVAGVDEAGRGCLAGPVVAAAVVLPPDLVLDGVTDSKKLNPTQRERAADEIRDAAVAYGIGLCTPAEIDRLNILWAAMEAMRRAVAHLDPAPEMLLIDGNRCFPDSPWPYETLVKGDRRSQSIAAASILAKTVRDELMRELHAVAPAYNWASNKGYPTQDHYAALAAHGPSPYHRRSFRLARA